MKIAIITDIHFGARNDSPFFLSEYEKFFEFTFFPTLEKEGITDLLVLGDTWENRKNLNMNTFFQAKKMFFEPLHKKGIQVKMIYGNHDVFYKDTNEVNAVDILGDLYDNIEIVPKYKVFNFDGRHIAMISWINNENLQESIQWMNTVDASVLCGHFEIKSVQMLKNQVCEHGFDKTQFNRFERVFSGHFHYMSDDGRIVYVSNPFQTNWSDYDLKKGFRIYDTKTGDLRTIENPNVLYQKLILDEDPDILSYDYIQHTGKIVKVYIRSFGKVNQNKIHIFMEELTKYANSVTLEEFDESISEILNDEKIFEYGDTESAISNYIKDVVNDDNIDKPRLKNMIMTLFNEAMTTSLTE